MAGFFSRALTAERRERSGQAAAMGTCPAAKADVTCLPPLPPPSRQPPPTRARPSTGNKHRRNRSAAGPLSPRVRPTRTGDGSVAVQRCPASCTSPHHPPPPLRCLLHSPSRSCPPRTPQCRSLLSPGRSPPMGHDVQSSLALNIY